MGVRLRVVNDEEPLPTPNQEPVAVLSSGSEGQIGSTVLFSAAGSFDPDDDEITYDFTLTPPGGSAAVLAMADVLSGSFVRDVAGSYVLDLVVEDVAGLTATAQATWTAVVSTTLPAPVVVDWGSDRSGRTALAAATVTGDVYAGVEDDGDIAQVENWNPALSWALDGEGHPTDAASRTDVAAPFDSWGGGTTTIPNPLRFDSTLLADGEHTWHHRVTRISDPTPIWVSPTFTVDNPTPVEPTAGTLDLATYDEVSHTYPNDPVGSTPIQIVDDGGVQKVRVRIYGELEGSRRGAHYVYETFGPYDDLYLVYKIRFHPGFEFFTSGFGPNGGGKMGVGIYSAANPNRRSGGGKFFEDSTSARIIFNDSNGQVSMKTYLYPVHLAGQWHEWEAARIFDGITGSQLDFNEKQRFNHWQIGGNRGASGADETAAGRFGGPRYPGSEYRSLWQDYGNSRYIGRASSLGSPYVFDVGDTIDLQIRVKMNTFASSTVSTGSWMGTVNRPNKDGLYQVRAKRNGGSAVTLQESTDGIWRYPTVPTQGFNTITVGAAAGGPYEGCQGILDIWDVRYGSEAIF